MMNGKTSLEVSPNGQKLGKACKQRIGEWLADNLKEVKKTWKKDSKATAQEEAGPTPKTAEEWVRAVQ
eukprot:773628-Karenia_brevis.AAC.1